MHNPISWFEIYVDDMQRARTFYQAVFEVELARLDTPDLEMWAFPMQEEGYGAGGALVKMPGVQSGGNSTLVYFACTDCAIEADRARQAGGRVAKEKMSIGPYGFIALIIDSEGNMIGLHSMQ